MRISRSKGEKKKINVSHSLSIFLLSRMRGDREDEE
jgi:hypothetical protein